jgi:hypothetical protein
MDGAIYSRAGVAQFSLYRADKRTWVSISDPTLIQKLMIEGNRFKISSGDAEKSQQTISSHTYEKTIPEENVTPQKMKNGFLHHYCPEKSTDHSG